MNPEKLAQQESSQNTEKKELAALSKEDVLKGISDTPIKSPTEYLDQKKSPEYSQEKYEHDKNTIFDLINSNTGFKDKDEYYYNVTGSQKKGDEFVKENYMMLANPEQLKKRVIIKNNITIKNNFINHKDEPIIDIDQFMKSFGKEQETIRTKFVEKKVIRDVVEIKPTFKEGVVASLEELSAKDQALISQNFDKILLFDQDIQDITITGKADATRPRTWDKLSLQANTSLNLLKSHGLNENLLNTIQLASGKTLPLKDLLEKTDDPNRLNMLWALNRALMQIDFLDQKHINLLNTSLKLKIVLDAQEVDGPNTGNEFTGGGIVIGTKGSEHIEKQKIELPLKELNSPLSFFHININLTDPSDVKNGTIELVYRDHTLQAFKSNSDKSVGLGDLYDRKNSHLAVYPTAFPDYGNPVLNLDLSNKDVGFDTAKEIKNTMLSGERSLAEYENVSTYHKKSNEFFNKIESTPEGFIKLLELYKSKTNKPDEQKYLDGVIQIIRSLASYS